MAISAPRQIGGWLGISLTIIAGFEGLYTYAYRDVIGVKTVCYGHIEGVKMGDHYTVAQCKQMLADDLPRYNDAMMKCIHVPMSDKEHAAYLSLAFNIGTGGPHTRKGFCNSTVARRLNSGDHVGACQALLMYNRAGGRVIRGLENRRRQEYKICMEGVRGR